MDGWYLIYVHFYTSKWILVNLYLQPWRMIQHLVGNMPFPLTLSDMEDALCSPQQNNFWIGSLHGAGGRMLADTSGPKIANDDTPDPSMW